MYRLWKKCIVTPLINVIIYVNNSTLNSYSIFHDIYIHPTLTRVSRDRMVVGFTTTYAISYLWQASGILWVILFPPLKQNDHPNITEILH